MPSAQTRDKSSSLPGSDDQGHRASEGAVRLYPVRLSGGDRAGLPECYCRRRRAIVVTTPEVSAIRDADRIVGLLEANGFEQMDLVINRLRMDMVKRGDMMSAADVVDILGISLLGIVPDDESVVIATNQGEPLVDSDTPAGRAYGNVVRRVMGEEVPFLNFEKGISFWTKVTGIFHKA